MDLLELFKKISELYPSYRKQRTTNSADPAYQLVVKSAPELLNELSGRQELLKFEGSTGRGYIHLRLGWLFILILLPPQLMVSILSIFTLCQ